mmetsp:Transcript_1670/g.4415  ORF Transcript_1670/g.4415 Transcript_1670/m.4415 type:complete len:230 (-) Transcript_1670:2247-2936(-)
MAGRASLSAGARNHWLARPLRALRMDLPPPLSQDGARLDGDAFTSRPFLSREHPAQLQHLVASGAVCVRECAGRRSTWISQARGCEERAQGEDRPRGAITRHVVAAQVRRARGGSARGRHGRARLPMAQADAHAGLGRAPRSSTALRAVRATEGGHRRRERSDATVERGQACRSRHRAHAAGQAHSPLRQPRQQAAALRRAGHHGRRRRDGAGALGLRNTQRAAARAAQ